MESNPVCKIHGKPILMVCTSCKELLCFKCPALHTEKGCKSSIDLPTYAAKVLLPKYRSQLDEYEKRKHFIQASAREFESSSEKLKNDLLKLKTKLESVLSYINATISLLKNGVVQSKYGIVNNTIENEYKLIKKAVEEENISYIVEKMKSKESSVILGMGDGEQQLLETIKNSISCLIDFKEFETLEQSLKVLGIVYKRANTQSVLSLEGNYIYGICYKVGEYKRLCKYDIRTKKLIPTKVTTYGCTITQIGNRIFLSGGDEPVVNTLNEYIEESQTLIAREHMNYSKCEHKAEPISFSDFVTVGGNDGNSSISYCEQYSLKHNKWLKMPSLNRSRRFPATAFLNNKYLYAIGGIGSNNEIEMLDLGEWLNWVTINLLPKKLDFDDGPAAFPISPHEIMILYSGSARVDRQ